jgi:hypothetical protein
MKKSIFLFLMGLQSLMAQEFVPRANYGALLEPRDKLMHGAGQSQAAHRNYREVMLENQKPAVIMTYIGLKGISSNWTVSLKEEILSYQPQFVIPQIGLSMTQDGNPAAHYEGDVAAGLMDREIDALIEGLRQLASPCYLRIGYEFNGLSWNGYQPATYINAFIRITQKIREADLEVATVWDAAVGGVTSYMDYYPGDTIVDWWGINPFPVTDFTHPNLPNFIASAKAHGKPVMIGESTPTYVGVLQGETSWTKWFVPYFNMLHANEGIKMFCYINWNWGDYEQWKTWGDCRLEMNAVVAGHYNDEMKAETYLHAATESQFRSTLDYSDDTAPGEIQNLRLASTSPLALAWDSVVDVSGLSHYIVYDSTGIAGYTLTNLFAPANIFAGQELKYRVTAMDRAGNESLPSAWLVTQAPDELVKSVNGDFENGFNGWSTDVWGGAASFMEETTNPISGTKSARITVTQSSNTAWHIQLRQWMRIRKGYTYQVSYTARANRNLSIQNWIQQDQAPYTIYSNRTATLTTISKAFSYQFTATVDDQVYLEFVFGSIGLAEVWLDDVLVTEVAPVSSTAKVDHPGGQSALFQNYPNPCTTNTTLEFYLCAEEVVNLWVSSLSGKVITLIRNQTMPAGLHRFTMNLDGMVSGIYFYTLQTNSLVDTKKMLVAH